MIYWCVINLFYANHVTFWFLYSFQNRIFLPNKKARGLLQAYACGKGVSSDDFLILKDLVANHQPSLVPLLCQFESNGHTSRAPTTYRRFLSFLCCPTSVCATVHIDNDLQLVLNDIINGQSPTQCVTSTSTLCKKCPVLADLLSKVEATQPLSMLLFFVSTTIVPE